MTNVEQVCENTFIEKGSPKHARRGEEGSMSGIGVKVPEGRISDLVKAVRITDESDGFDVVNIEIGGVDVDLTIEQAQRLAGVLMELTVTP